MNTHDFCRASLKLTMIEVRKETTVAQRKHSWAWRDTGGWFEFTGPDGFYTTGSACCLYEAKARGLGAYLHRNDCSDCNGDGEVTYAVPGMTRGLTETCKICKGTGRTT